VISYETQSPFVVPERIDHRGVLEAAIHIAQCPFGYFDDRAGHASGSEHDAERAASCGSDQPAHDAASGFIGFDDAAA
jgi:hypothetical protein